MDEGLVMASDYFYTTGENAGQPKPGTSPETNVHDLTFDLPEGIPAQPDDYSSVPYEYDPASGAWVKLIN